MLAVRRRSGPLDKPFNGFDGRESLPADKAGFELDPTNTTKAPPVNGRDVGTPWNARRGVREWNHRFGRKVDGHEKTPCNEALLPSVTGSFVDVRRFVCNLEVTNP